jgi:hypothetical protein
MRFLVLTFVSVSLALSSCKKLDIDSIKNLTWNPKFASSCADADRVYLPDFGIQ